MGFVIDTIISGIKKYPADSDRGVHYTNNVYQMLLKNNNIQQSMSASATPRDNNYNYTRKQWSKNKMTPIEYKNFLLVS